MSPPQTEPNDALLAPFIDRRDMAYELDAGLGDKGRIGLVLLATDQTLEHEFRCVLTHARGVTTYTSRIHNTVEITPESLASMANGITEATSLLVPQLPLDVVCYACTSGTLVIGEEVVHAKIRAARPDVACTTPMEAAVAALHALERHRICFLPPYRHDINDAMRQALIARGVDVPVMGSWNVSDDDKVARLSRNTVSEAILQLGSQPQCDAVFVACTNVRAAGFAAELETALGKPVISSNLATIWHCLRLAGYEGHVPGFGRLFDLP